MLELILVDHTQFLWNFSREQCVILFDYVAVDLNTKFCLDLFSALVTRRKNSHCNNSFTS